MYGNLIVLLVQINELCIKGGRTPEVKTPPLTPTLN